MKINGKQKKTVKLYVVSNLHDFLSSVKHKRNFLFVHEIKVSVVHTIVWVKQLKSSILQYIFYVPQNKIRSCRFGCELSL